MDRKTISIGSSGKGKKPLKEINFDVKIRHIFSAFLFLIAFVGLITYILIILGFATVQDAEVTCTDGIVEEIKENKTIYCGDHYSVLQPLVSKGTYENLEKIINGR